MAHFELWPDQTTTMVGSIFDDSMQQIKSGLIRFRNMRLWSLHPKYLDTKGLVALWREALLAQAVLRGETRGYLNHPQLQRFKATRRPLTTIATYLAAIHQESVRRNFKFDLSKIGPERNIRHLPVTRGQLDYEFAHLKQKLKLRDETSLKRLYAVKRLEAHPLFIIVPGSIEAWERIKI